MRDEREIRVLKKAEEVERGRCVGVTISRVDGEDMMKRVEQF